MLSYAAYEYISSRQITLGSIIAVIVFLLCIAAEWKIYEKAGEEGWKAIVPIYRLYIFYKITLGNGWLFILQFIPIVNMIAHAYAEYKLCKGFGHDVLFFLGLFFLPFIFEMYLGFGDDRYVYYEPAQ